LRRESERESDKVAARTLAQAFEMDCTSLTARTGTTSFRQSSERKSKRASEMTHQSSLDCLSHGSPKWGF
jgi:hypothetical protein